MAKLKYADGVSKLLNEHSGYTFQPNHYGQSTFPASKSGRFRRPSQNAQQQNLMKAVTFWRDMDYSTKNNWNTFAATYPQASRRNPDLFLSGYQLFLKRCHYCFLNNGITSDFMTEPTLEELEAPEFTVQIIQSDNSLDCSENYLKYFGRFPEAGDYVLCKIYPMAEYSGQFFEPIELTIQVEEVYIDGLFLSFLFPESVPNVVFSVYLSKVVYQSVNYIGTKIRYMGCFTPKTFKALTDIPNVTAADDGKVWGVGPDGTWQLIEAGGGGGLTCEDLVECPAIINLQNSIAAIAKLLIPVYDTSIPTVKMGLLYNHFTAVSPNNFCPAGWHVPSDAELTALRTLIGTNPGAALKEASLTYWLSPNTGATNSLKYNSRGGGSRNGSSGIFSSFMQIGYISTITIYSSIYRFIFDNRYNSTAWNRTGSGHLLRAGYSYRFIKDTPTTSHGEISSMVAPDGRIYRTVNIYGYEIMSDNYATTVFRNGVAIPEITDSATWTTTNEPALCAYGNDWDNV